MIVFLFQKKSAPVLQKSKPFNEQATLLESLNGTQAESVLAEKRPIAVMVENHPDARPQSGLADADIVYEAPTESGITRFMAVFQTKDAKNIGPVRSARMYFVELANELGAVYAHVGGNSDALADIRTGLFKNISDADQFFNDVFFQRVKFRKMPHNVYTSVEKLEKLISKHQFKNQATYESWQFKDDSAVATSTAQSINIDFSQKEYSVNWQYNKTDNSYKRFLDGRLHKDLDSGKQIIVKNIITQFVKTAPSKTDTLFSINIDLDSGGKSVAFLDGKAVEGTWKKQNGRTRYYDQANQEISFNRGPTWVELVPVEKSVVWK